MRQREQSSLDNQLRTALENMRFGACTSEDITFLRTRVASNRPGYPRLDDPKFRDASIITALNVHKDVINDLGAERFAAEKGEELLSFYSIDSLSTQAVNRRKWMGCAQATFRSLGAKLKNALWNAPASTTVEQIPGCLKLCKGMPVMLKTNDATELCITKGQEGIVVGWDSSTGPGPDNQKILDNLFVELTKPPRTIKIPGLPDNVVPMSRTSRHVTALLQDDSLLSINREQVLVLPNFAMTDYGSQGKSRDPNVVHLNNCKDHKAYYVALSRGHKAENTVILQGFDEQKITKGMNGHLRQEFRELEMLDEITRLKFEGALPSSVTGLYRKDLLSKYKAWKGDKARQDPTHFHPALRYNRQLDEFEEPVMYGQWEPNVKKRKSAIKRKTKEGDESSIPPTKKQNLGTGIIPTSELQTIQSSPRGLIWDCIHYSCAYDSLFTCLLNVWSADPDRWTTVLSEYSALMSVWAAKMKEEPLNPELARDTVREILHYANPLEFPAGPVPIRLDPLFTAMTDCRTYATAESRCELCTYKETGTTHTFSQLQELGVSASMKALHPEGVGLNAWYINHLDKLIKVCPCCRDNGRTHRMRRTTTLNAIPPVLILGINSTELVMDDHIHLSTATGNSSLRLAGLIYHSPSAVHFTCMVVDVEGRLWYHDGMTTKRNTLFNGKLSN
ncbi:hypothetical protein K438DRAFT_1553662, partial [Mycena galopus ATCC 62051]